jgi:hypothetical protein
LFDHGVHLSSKSSRTNPSAPQSVKFWLAAQIPALDDSPTASLEIAEDAEKGLFAKGEDRWT